MGNGSFVGLYANDASNEEIRRKDPHGFRRLLRDMVLNFLIAGRDTTAQCLTWTIYELTQNSSALAKLREEVYAVCASREITCNDVKELRYVRASLNEGL